MMLRPLTLPRQEDEDAAALQLAHDLDGHLVVLGAANDGAEARHAAVDELDAPGAQLHVVDWPVQLHLVAVQHEVAGAEALLVLAPAERHDLRLGAAREAHAFDDLFGKQRGDARVERLAQVGQPHRVARHGVQQAAARSSTPGRSPSFSTRMPVKA